jgi:chemotaxis protein MotA
MYSLPIGFIAVAAVIFSSVNLNDWGLFLNLHAIVIVFGGSVAILALSTPVNVLKNMMKALIELFDSNKAADEYWREFESLFKSRTLPTPSANPLINYAVGLWESGTSGELFIVLISQKRAELENMHADAVQTVRNLAKYPPALGMTGTVVGLVSLFSKLGTDNRAELGPALALAMTATFFGLILANVIIMPIADRLHVQFMWKKSMYTQVYQAITLINRGDSIELLKDDHEKLIAS